METPLFVYRAQKRKISGSFDFTERNLHLPKNIIEREYNDQEKVNEDFLFTMLLNGYIDENYSDFLSTSYKELFEKDEFTFLNNIKEDNEPDFKLVINNTKSVENKIKPHQWSHPSILNNNILTDLINKSQSSKLGSFIIAISNYYEKYQKSDFIDQYIASINELNEKKKIVNILFNELSKKIKSDIPTEIKNSLLLSFFSNNSGFLFCEFLNICTNNDDIIAKLLNTFFENRPSVLVYTLNKSEKKKLSDFKFEIEKISFYDDSTQQLLINNAMFQISKDNLDYLIAKQNIIPPHYYYDYIRTKSNLKKKILESKYIEKFANEILLTDDKIYISEEGIIDFFFTTLIEDDIAEQISIKLNNEFINLTYLPKFFKENTKFILSLHTSLFHILIEQNKIKIDFNNLLYLSSSCSAEDTILFAQKHINRQTKNTSLEKIDSFAKDVFLSSFYNFLLTEQKVNLDLFAKESNFLIKQNTDILELITPLFKENKVISTNKMQTLIELAFRRTNPNKNSNKIFLTIIKNGWIYFRQNFTNIKNNSNDNWKINTSILLINKDNILSENHIDELINLISLDEFCDIIKLWDNEIDLSPQQIIEKILTERRFNSLLEKYGHTKTFDFLNSIKNIINYETEDKLSIIIEQKNIFQIYNIASKYELYQNTIINYNYAGSFFDKIINQLQNDFHFNWEMSKTIISQNAPLRNSFVHSKSFYYKALNDLFVLGRYFYDAMENGKIYVDDFFSEKNTTLLNYSKTYPLNPILCGLVFEAYFDRKGILKKESKKLFFDQLIEHMEPYKGSKCLDFIKECLKLFNNRVIYIPGDPDIIFKINGNITENEMEINSITCFGVELLTKSPNISDTGILAVQGSKSDLIRSIRQYFTIPNYRIKLEPAFDNYMLKDGMDFIQPLSSIALLINNKKKLKEIEKDFK